MSEFSLFCCGLCCGHWLIYQIIIEYELYILIIFVYHSTKTVWELYPLSHLLPFLTPLSVICQALLMAVLLLPPLCATTRWRIRTGCSWPLLTPAQHSMAWLVYTHCLLWRRNLWRLLVDTFTTWVTIQTPPHLTQPWQPPNKTTPLSQWAHPYSPKRTLPVSSEVMMPRWSQT